MNNLCFFTVFQHIHCNGSNDEETGDDLEDVVADLDAERPGLTGVLNDSHQQRADEGAGDRAAAACQRCTADNGSSDGVHVIAFAGVRHCAEDTTGKHHSGNAVDEAGNGINQIEGLTNFNTGQTGNLDTGTDNKQVTSENGIAKYQECNQRYEDPNTRQNRQESKDIVVADLFKQLDEGLAVRFKEGDGVTGASQLQDAAVDGLGAERRDHCGNIQVKNDNAVDEAADDTDDKVQNDSKPNRLTRTDHQCHGHAAETGNCAAGNVDAARDDDKRLRNCKDADDCALLCEVHQVILS